MPIEFLSEEEASVVKAEQIKAFFRETNDQNFAGALVLSLLVYVVSDKIPGWTWQPALFTLYAVTLVRAWLVWQYHRNPTRYSTAEWARSHGAPELAVPKKIMRVAEVPMLGTGKTDYVRIQQMAELEKAA